MQEPFTPVAFLDIVVALVRADAGYSYPVEKK